MAKLQSFAAAATLLSAALLGIPSTVRASETAANVDLRVLSQYRDYEGGPGPRVDQGRDEDGRRSPRFEDGEIRERFGSQRTIVIVGRLVRGVECPALRATNGRLYSLATRSLRGLRPGDWVRVVGRRAQVSTCMRGTTLDVRHIRRIY